MKTLTRPGPGAGICLSGLVLLLIGTVWLIPSGLALHVSLAEDDTPVLVLPLAPGERFTLHYYHSVENAPIWEDHSIDDSGTIFIEEERYEKFGAGMGKLPGVGRMMQKGHHEAIVDMHHPVGAFVLRVGSQGVAHTLIWRNRRFNLSDKFSHQRVRFSGRSLTLYQTVRYLTGFGRPGPWPEPT
ncbi:MAG: DUF1850 domain-containing protein [Desulfotignum sp.]